MNDRPIGIFDSGLGGLTVLQAMGSGWRRMTVLQAMADLLPAEHLIYFGDTARYPYGPRSTEQLQEFSVQIVDFLLEHGVKMIVIACNSATAAALDLLRERYEIPIIGVVEPGIRAASSATRTGRVGVIGTQMTAESKVYEHTAQRLRSGLDLTVLACPGFVELVEEGETRGARARRVVAAGLKPLEGSGIDALVLGCTHYPLLARTIGEAMGREVTLVSSADETAFEVRHILETTGWMRDSDDTEAMRKMITSGNPDRFRELGERFLGYPLEGVSGMGW